MLRLRRWREYGEQTAHHVRRLDPQRQRAFAKCFTTECAVVGHFRTFPNDSNQELS